MANQHLLDTFLKLVKIDSPSGNENTLATYLINNLKDKLDIVQKDRYGNIYGRLNGEGNPLFFTGHLDTVEPGRGIKPQIKDGYITSDGTTILGADNKSSLACMLQTIMELKTKKIPHFTLEFIFTKEEETTNAGAQNFDYSLLQAKKGFCFDSVSPLGTIILGSPFYERFDLNIIGKAAHASKPEQGINVLSVIKEVLNHFPLGKLDDNTIFNIGTFTGGYVRNTVPSGLTIQGEIRGFVEALISQHKQKFIKVVHTACELYKASYKLEFVEENKGYKYTENSVIKDIRAIMKRIHITPQPITAWAVSDANIFNNRGLTCINLGDGVQFPHSAQERIKTSDMEKLVDLMVQLVKI